MVLVVKIGSPNFTTRPSFDENSAIFQILNAAAVFPRSRFLKSFWFNWEILWYTFREGIAFWGSFTFRSKIFDLEIQKNAKRCWLSIFFFIFEAYSAPPCANLPTKLYISKKYIKSFLCLTRIVLKIAAAFKNRKISLAVQGNWVIRFWQQIPFLKPLIDASSMNTFIFEFEDIQKMSL